MCVILDLGYQSWCTNYSNYVCAQMISLYPVTHTASWRNSPNLLTVWGVKKGVENVTLSGVAIAKGKS
jgi:hypothetical protein